VLLLDVVEDVLEYPDVVDGWRKGYTVTDLGTTTKD
jgi:hypothetical protein